MLGKLVKYDLRSMARIFVPLWIMTPVITLLFGLSLQWSLVRFEHAPAGAFWEGGIVILVIAMGILFAGVIIALAVVTLLFVIQRFWKGLLKEEGYLMFTLPVETWKLITAKGLSATLVSCVSLLVGIFSCLVLAVASSEELIRNMVFIWNRLVEILFDEGPGFWAVAASFVLLALLGTVADIYQIYASMALGQLFTGHRVIGAFVSYVGISVALSVVGGVLMLLGVSFVPRSVWYMLNSSEYHFWLLYFLSSLLSCVLLIALFHCITERILSKKLNLE